MNKRSKRYTDEFKMLILELLEEGRTKKSLENEYGIITAEYTVKYRMNTKKA